MHRKILRHLKAVCGYGLALSLFVLPQAAQAGSFHVLYTFKNGLDGANPMASLIRDKAGNVYGTTYYGGAFGRGVAFKVDTQGVETVLYPFYSATGDGADPQAGLLKDRLGNFFGTTQSGGTVGGGTAFEIHPDGSESVLHSFGSYTGDGCYPRSNLLLGTAGVFYGTASACGSNDRNNGTIFYVTPDGEEYTIYQFSGGADGSIPLGALITDPNGDLFGTASAGGQVGCIDTAGCGTVFNLDKNGVFHLLYTFTGGNDGGNPSCALVSDSSGTLYGTTEYGGTKNLGVVFELSPKGHLTVLHSFKGGADGANPVAGLIRDAAGNLYGTTWQGGGCSYGQGCGTVFKLAPDGKETVLHAFSGGNDGSGPVASLIADDRGELFGTAAYGGSAGYGTLFEIAE